MENSDDVLLAVPALPQYLRLARVTAAGLASRIGFSFEEVEDLRLAVDELCYGLTGNEEREGIVEVRFHLGSDTLLIEGEGRFAKRATEHDRAFVDPGVAGTVEDPTGPFRFEPGTGGLHLSVLSRAILDTLVDEHHLETSVAGARFRLVKTHMPVPRR